MALEFRRFFIKSISIDSSMFFAKQFKLIIAFVFSALHASKQKSKTRTLGGNTGTLIKNQLCVEGKQLDTFGEVQTGTYIL